MHDSFGVKAMKIIRPDKGQIFDIELEENLLRKNQELAVGNRRLLDSHRVFGVDVLGSIGSGKTTLIQGMVKFLGSRFRIGAVAGDLTTTIDADRIESQGAAVVQINTGKECHLDANLVRKAFSQLDLENLDLVLIENVGNLICPGEFPVGAHCRIVVVSTTEGPYMITKHPYILMEASVVVINKIDLAGAMQVDIEKLKSDARSVKPDLHVVFTNARTGEGIPDLVEALKIPNPALKTS